MDQNYGWKNIKPAADKLFYKGIVVESNPGLRIDFCKLYLGP